MAAQFLNLDQCSMRLSRQAVKLESDSPEPGYDPDLSEMHTKYGQPRIGTLVRFKREDLLP